MIVVTGGCGFIGSNIVKQLNEQHYTDILVVDNLENGRKLLNIADLHIADYMHKDEFLRASQSKEALGATHIIHQGACSATTNWDGNYVMQTNFSYSKDVLNYALNQNIPLIYASSAAVYGKTNDFAEMPENELPLNAYGYSKLLFDQYVRRNCFSQAHLTSQIVGLRYFNVFGPRETHKGAMASVAYHLSNQIDDTGECRLFGAYDGIHAGEQLRDFVYVKDCVSVIDWFIKNPSASGIFNVGSGKAESFNALAEQVIKAKGRGELKYVDFPDHLKNAYQSYTQADLTQLRDVGCDHEFHSLEKAVEDYMRWMARL